ncbi:MAG TPA: hypothetical protein VII76_12470 [Acidimicrobiales bacterium]
MAIAIAIAAATFMVPFGGTASAATTVNTPAGNPTDAQTITVTGSGFPVRSALPSGLEIIECADPGGTTTNLPTDAATSCDGTTVSGGQINTDASGNFTAQYPIELLNSGNSSINCDATDFCVLWVGQDFNGAFLSGPHGFSSAFEIQSVAPVLGEAPLAISLPVIAAAIVGVYVFLRRRRAQPSVTV